MVCNWAHLQRIFSLIISKSINVLSPYLFEHFRRSTVLNSKKPNWKSSIKWKFQRSNFIKSIRSTHWRKYSGLILLGSNKLIESFLAFRFSFSFPFFIYVLCRQWMAQTNANKLQLNVRKWTRKEQKCQQNQSSQDFHLK